MEALDAVLPVTLIVFVLCVTITPMSLATLLMFLVGAVLLIVGMGFFSLGADIAMMPIGEHTGSHLTKMRTPAGVAAVCFAIGVFITIAEPDLQVLARQTPAVPDMVLILCVACGVGVFLALAFLRTLYGWPLARILIICYLLVFALAAFVPREFLPVAFDSGGVTTGPITVPFIMALGLGLSSVGHSDHSDSDSFGLVALCSIGPILAVLVLGLVYSAASGSYTPLAIPEVNTTRELWMQFSNEFPTYAQEVLLALAPILIFFLIFQAVCLHLRANGRWPKILMGMLYTFLGLTLFLTGVNVGYARRLFHWQPAGRQRLALAFGAAWHADWLFHCESRARGAGFEPAGGGSDGRRHLCAHYDVWPLCRHGHLGGLPWCVLTGISILWLLVLGYALALGLKLVVPKIFTSIAFDSGGVASGPMTATFLLSFAMGAVMQPAAMC